MPKITASDNDIAPDDLQENPLRSAWKRFSSLNTFTKLLIITLIVVLPIEIYYLGSKQTNINSSATAADQLEAEGGVLGGSATVVSDPNASGGRSILFAVNSPTLTKTPTPTQTLTPTKTPTPTITPTQTPVGGLVIRGYGANTVGGTGQPIVHVTNLNDSGAGSLRSALSSGNRRIVFDVGGTITLSDYLRISNLSYITIDGSTAPSPGITLLGWPLFITGSHDIIVTQLRDGPSSPTAGPNAGSSSGDGGVANFSIKDGSYNIVFDHLSARGFTDGGIDLYRDVHDVTVQWSIIGPGQRPAHNYQSLNGGRTQRITYDHVLFFESDYRNPEANYGDLSSSDVATDPIDVTNSLIWKFISYGTVVTMNSKVNVRGTYYYSTVNTGSNRAIHTETGGIVYAAGNKSKNGGSLATNTSASTPFAVSSYAQIPIEDPTSAALTTIAKAGCRVGGLDAYDTTALSSIAIN